MVDLVKARLPIIKAQRIEGLELEGDFIFPCYHGNSILNIPASICHLFGVPRLGAKSLASDLLAPLGSNAQHVIVILVDALTLRRFQTWIEDGTAPVWKKLIDQGIFAPITSVVPSTTSAAITSLWTGRSPKEHGIVGYELWLKEYGVVANMILHSPMSFRDGGGSLEKAGFESDKYLSFTPLGTHLLNYGIETYVFQDHSIVRSGLSQMFLHNVKFLPVGTQADLWVGVRQWLESQPTKRSYAWVYWSEVDHLSHFDGPDNERAVAEFALFSHAFETIFLNKLSAEVLRDTVIILTADHGQVATPKNPHNDLRNHPKLDRRLHIKPTGENRLAFLHIRPGQSQAVQDYIASTWKGKFRVFYSAQVTETDLFGPGEAHPGLSDRMGDFLVIAEGNQYWWWNDRKENPLLGRHGGLHADEMIVPFLAARF